MANNQFYVDNATNSASHVTDNDSRYVTLGKVTTGIASFALIIFYLFASQIVQAWVLVKLWAWYVVPYFGIVQIDMVHAFGISLIVSHLTHSIKPRNKSDDKATISTITKLFFSTVTVRLMGLFIGWVVTFFF